MEVAAMSRQTGDRAVVLGASMAGLLAARVLADAYRRVTIIERDRLPVSGLERKGVPQGRHAHALLPRGAQILDELFPGLLAGLEAGGIPVLHAPREFRFVLGGHLLCQDGEPGEPGYTEPAIPGSPRPRPGPGPAQRDDPGPVCGGRPGHHVGR
jgi:hypothetical protein